MCYTFPRIASCEYYRFGSGGGQDKISALCILGLNIVNDKVRVNTWVTLRDSLWANWG
jgi:Innexin